MSFNAISSGRGVLMVIAFMMRALWLGCITAVGAQTLVQEVRRRFLFLASGQAVGSLQGIVACYGATDGG